MKNVKEFMFEDLPTIKIDEVYDFIYKHNIYPYEITHGKLVGIIEKFDFDPENTTFGELPRYTESVDFYGYGVRGIRYIAALIDESMIYLNGSYQKITTLGTAGAMRKKFRIILTKEQSVIFKNNQ